MSRAAVIVALVSWSGLTLLLSELRWIQRVPLRERLTPHAPGPRASRPRGAFSVESLGDVVAPLAITLGQKISRIVGVSEDIAARLHRVHSPLDATTVRVRQLRWSCIALVVAAALAEALAAPPAVAIFLVLSAPVLSTLVIEQQVANASATWQRQLFRELPVIAEQLAMLSAAGWSIGAALAHVATRGSGACATDIERVVRRMRQGLSEADALREWAASADVEALHRLVSVLVLNREAVDLAHLISEEARAIRRDSQRELIEHIERRNQQVWIPVTVAALIPGVLLMGVPFVDALRLFSR